MNDAGVALIQGVAAAGNGVAHARAFSGTPTLDQVVLTTRATHHVPPGAWAVVFCQRDGNGATVFRLYH